MFHDVERRDKLKQSYYFSRVNRVDVDIYGLKWCQRETKVWNATSSVSRDSFAFRYPNLILLRNGRKRESQETWLARLSIKSDSTNQSSTSHLVHRRFSKGAVHHGFKNEEFRYANLERTWNLSGITRRFQTRNGISIRSQTGNICIHRTMR